MTFQYENFKRHSFTLTVKGKKADSKSVDLSTNGYQFDFYVMGTIGVRAGIRAKATVGLFSTKLAGIGLQIEAGAYARLWGYFYYHLENWKIAGKWQKESSYSGAVLIEIGAYLDVKFIAEALNGKYPTPRPCMHRSGRCGRPGNGKTSMRSPWRTIRPTPS